MVHYDKNGIYHTRYKEFTIDQLDDNDLKEFKLGKIDGKLGIQFKDVNHEDIDKSIEKIKNGFDHLAKEFGNMQPLFRNKFNINIEKDYDNSRIKLVINVPEDIKHILPMFMNQIVYSLISVGFINRNNPKMISKDLYEKYIGPAPKVNQLAIPIYKQLIDHISDIMVECGYSKKDINKVVNNINEEIGVTEYLDMIFNISNDHDIDIDNIEKYSLDKKIEFINIIANVFDLDLESFSDKKYKIDFSKYINNQEIERTS